MKKTVFSSSEKETKAIAVGIAEEIKGLKRSKAVIIALSGDLGAGKTVFTKGFVSAMGVNGRITSPTFVVSKRYAVKKGSFKNIFHMDCYRIRDPKELLVLGFKDMVSNPSNIILIEWPENIGRISADFRISIDHLPEENRRKIVIERK